MYLVNYLFLKNNLRFGRQDFEKILDDDERSGVKRSEKKGSIRKWRRKKYHLLYQCIMKKKLQKNVTKE